MGFSISLSLNFRYKVFKASIIFGGIWGILGYFVDFFSGILVFHYPPLADPEECNIHPFGQVVCMSISQRFLTSNFCSDVLISIPLHVFRAGTGIEKGSPFSDGESCRNSLLLPSLS